MGCIEESNRRHRVVFPDWNSIEEFNSVGAGLDA